MLQIRAMKTVDPLSFDLATLASLAGVAANDYLLAQLRAAGHRHVRTSHGYVFQHLIAGKPTVGELAIALAVTPQGASKLVAEIEALGYAERVPDEDDSRVRRVALTATGRALIERSRAARQKLDAAMQRALGPTTMKAARRALVALLEHTGELNAITQRRAKPPTP